MQHGRGVSTGRAWLAVMAAIACFASPAVAAGHRTANFIVDAPTDALARRIGDAAEQYRQIGRAHV